MRDSEVVSVSMMSCEHQNVIEFKVSEGKRVGQKARCLNSDIND